MKLLIVVGEAPSAPTPPPAVVALLAAATDVRVVAPSLVGPLGWLTGGVDDARRLADDRLAAMLGHLEESGVDASGIRGDELAGTVFDDALDGFDADHVLLLPATTDTMWQKRKILDRLFERGLSVTVALVTPAS